MSERLAAGASFVLALALAAGTAKANDPSTHDPGRSRYEAPKAKRALSIDGVGSEPVWDRARWRPIENRWLGPEYSPDDFQGRFKVVWTQDKLYILVEVVDDILFDSHRDPLVQYWDDDCLEIFLDEDFSGGNHQYNHNAFAYHMSLDNRAIDIGTDKKAREYSHHVESHWRAQGNTLTWEVAIDVYSDAYVDDSTRNRPVKLSAGKVLGLMLAWCDNDGSELRENFVGSETAPGEYKDRGWIDAGLFGSLVLVE